MAIFEQSPQNVIYAAIDIFKAIHKENQTVPIDIGIGIHFSSLMVGIIGEQKPNGWGDN